jgi:glycosyltransferase involved in cell wall biosynthesis|nr:MAG: glycosyl transferase [Bacteroidota bacterium]
MVVLVGTYPPVRCGIATFNADLHRVLSARGLDVSVAVIAHPEETTGPFPEEVLWVISRHDRPAYRRLAHALSRAEVVILQHEYGLYGGRWGSWILEWAEELRAPLVTVFHTLLETPPPGLHEEDLREMRRIARELALRSEGVVVLLPDGVQMLERCGVPPERMVVIPHGVPEVPELELEACKATLGLSGPVLVTYGLLGPGKGIETVLEALTRLRGRFPDLTYLVAGSLHPNLHRLEGRRYLDELEKMAVARGLEANFRIREGYLAHEELVLLMGAADVVLLPYPNLEQISSGTLSFAMGAGKAIIATPFRHARLALRAGRGLLCPPGDPEAWAEAIARLLEEPQERARMGRRARLYAEAYTWPRIAVAYERLIHRLSRSRHEVLVG